MNVMTIESEFEYSGLDGNPVTPSGKNPPRIMYGCTGIPPLDMQGPKPSLSVLLIMKGFLKEQKDVHCHGKKKL